MYSLYLVFYYPLCMLCKNILLFFFVQITWIDGLGNVLHNGIETINEKYEDGPLFTVRSILKVMPRKEHDNTTFTCQSQNAADRTPQNAKLRVEVSVYYINIFTSIN